MDTNTRLLTAVQVATRKLVSGGNLEGLLPGVLAICIDAVGASGGTIYLHDRRARRLRFQHVLPAAVSNRLPFRDISDDFGVAGQVFHDRRTEISDFRGRNDASRAFIEQAIGVVAETMITVPLMLEQEEPIGVVQLVNKKDGMFTDADVVVLDTVAAVCTMAFINSRLVETSNRASSLLGMGRVSHDIGNLAASLHATLSYAGQTLREVREQIPPRALQGELEEGIEALSSSLSGLRKSVEQIVGYSRLISDLSAGRKLRPDKKPHALPPILSQSIRYLETEALDSHVRLRLELDEQAPPFPFDALYMVRIVQNLVGNGIRAVRDTIPAEWLEEYQNLKDVAYGDVVIRYRYADGMHRLEVEDTGPGMSADVIRQVLEGTARSQWEKATGSGWGLKIVLELAATHDARVSVDSHTGRGTTFRLEFPHSPRIPGLASLR